MTSPTLPAAVRAHLADPSLAGVWDVLAYRLERNGLTPTGTITVDLDATAADKVSGLLGRAVPPGPARLRLDQLDTALRGSAAATGLVAVTGALVGRALVDRRAAREENQAAWSSVWTHFDTQLAAAGLAAASWVPGYLDGVRRSGLLTRAGTATATSAITATCKALARLQPSAAGPPTIEVDIAALAGEAAGDAHAFDHGRLAAALLLRAAAAASGEPAPRTAADRRALWEALGVRPDAVSGTVLVWGLRPPGEDPWAAMMRARADLHLVTHLTSLELAAAPGQLADPGTLVSVVENPQVLQAAAHARTPHVLVCLSGNPAAAGRTLLTRLHADGADLRYHGDFDWPGVAIAARVLALGARPWRMSAGDYLDALDRLDPDAALPLDGSPATTPWDPELAAAMLEHGTAVHEEALLEVLLAELA
jgi:uncharacterized protein (TIGR02679 family)